MKKKGKRILYIVTSLLVMVTGVCFAGFGVGGGGGSSVDTSKDNKWTGSNEFDKQIISNGGIKSVGVSGFKFTGENGGFIENISSATFADGIKVTSQSIKKNPLFTVNNASSTCVVEILVSSTSAYYVEQFSVRNSTGDGGSVTSTWMFRLYQSTGTTDMLASPLVVSGTGLYTVSPLIHGVPIGASVEAVCMTSTGMTDNDRTMVRVWAREQ